MNNGIFQFNPNNKQAEALRYLFDETTSSVGYGGGAGGGKSFLGVFWCWFMCNLYPGVRYFFAREELKRLKLTTLVSYYEFLDTYNIPEAYRGKMYKDQEIKFENGSSILFIELKYYPSDDIGRKFGSYLLTGGFIDESYECNYKYVEALYTRINRWKNAELGIPGKILETFNPDKGHVYRRFHRPHVNNALPRHRKYVQALAADRLTHPVYFWENYALHPEDAKSSAGLYIQSLITNVENPETLERLLKGNFEYDDDPTQLIDSIKLQDLFENAHVEENENARYVIADIAAEGSDRFVIGVWYGWALVECVELDKSDPVTIIAILQGLKDRHRVPVSNVCYDSDGVGWFVKGWIKGAVSFKNNARPFPSEVEIKRAQFEGRTPQPENYQNLKTQCYYYLARRINSGEIYAKAINTEAAKDMLIVELSQVKTYEADKDGKLKILPKDKVKQIIGRSPDYADMFAMRMYYEVRPRPKRSAPPKSFIV